MARTNLTIDVPPDAVWAVLSDAYRYADWVVGAQKIRSVEGPWPRPGSRFHHCVGLGPFTVRDQTKSLAAEEPRRLVLDARARPVGRARVEITLIGAEGGSELTIDETVVAPVLMRGLAPLLAPLIRARNAKSLRRLGRLAGAGSPKRAMPS